jgi:hypothetical protein
MRLMGIEDKGSFREFKKIPFDISHEEKLLEDWIENNPASLLDDQALLPIGRQVLTNLGSYIDLLCLDREGNAVVVELKRDRTPRDTLAQALEYASFIADLDSDQMESILRTYTNDEVTSLAEYHRESFKLETNEAVAFNKRQSIVIVGQNVTREIRQTSNYLRSKGIDVKCVEFSYFEADDGRRLFSQDTVVGIEPLASQQTTSGAKYYMDKDKFFKSIDEFAKPVYRKLMDHAESNNLKISWHYTSCAINIVIDDWWYRLIYLYVPDSSYGQCIMTYFWGQNALENITKIPKKELQKIHNELQDSGLFFPAGMNLKCMVERKFSKKEMDKLVYFVDKLREMVLKYGVKEND